MNNHLRWGKSRINFNFRKTSRSRVLPPWQQVLRRDMGPAARWPRHGSSGTLAANLVQAQPAKGMVILEKKKNITPDEKPAVDATGETPDREQAVATGETPEIKNAAAEEPTGSSVSEESEDMNTLRAELEKQKDLFLRTVAEYDNFRKRTKREKEQFFTHAKCDLLLPLLPVFDSLARAIETESSTLEDYKKGVELVGAQLKECLTQLHVEEIGQPGEPFDPEKHDAVSHEEKPDAKENTIAQVLQKGYSVDGKILRHAIVSVYN